LKRFITGRIIKRARAKNGQIPVGFKKKQAGTGPTRGLLTHKTEMQRREVRLESLQNQEENEPMGWNSMVF